MPARLLIGALLLASGAPMCIVEGQRTIAIDERLAADATLRVGERTAIAATPDAAPDTVVVGAIVRRRPDPSELARGEYRVRMHLDHLQRMIGYDDRVDRFAIATRDSAATAEVQRFVNDVAFGFRAHRSRDIAVETSATFIVVSRFHRAIGVITVVASAIFLLCIMLLKIDERRRDVAALRLIGISTGTVMRSVMIEAAFIAAVGSVLGVGIGVLVSAGVNWHYRGVYRTPLAFSLITTPVLVFAVALSLVLGLVAGYLAARRLLSIPPLSLFGR